MITNILSILLSFIFGLYSLIAIIDIEKSMALLVISLIYGILV